VEVKKAMIEIWEKPLSLDTVIAKVSAPHVGAVSTFSGIVRNHNLGKAVRYLEYECYAAMAEKEMAVIREYALKAWALHDIAILHRVGRLEIGESAVVIAVASAHREDGLVALKYTIDTLKATVPIWKKEYWADGSMWLENCCG
jgi:molybdopterin synthase catalytic subunit